MMTEIISIQPFNCINEDDAESNYGEISVFSDFKNKGYRLSDNIINNVGRETISRNVMHSKNVLNSDRNEEKVFLKRKRTFRSIPPRRRRV
jgi:hypothetical protein